MGRSADRCVRAWVRLLLGSIFLLVAPPATASPSFDLYVSTGGVTELAVGHTLQLRALHPPPTCLPCKYVGKTRKPAPPAEMAVVWSVEPADLATITQDGLLTAAKPGQIHVRVECRDPKAPSCDLTMPGQTWLNLYKDLPGGRLPHLDGGPRLEEFHFQWDATAFQSRHVLEVGMTGAAFAWSAGFATPTTPDHAFPWVFDAESGRRWFDDDDGVEDREHDEARHRANVTSARLTLDSWKDGVLSGRIELKTTRGIEYDTTFQARFGDRDGLLARAAAPTPDPPSPAPEPGMK